MDVELKPCPFCGREPRLLDLAGYEVICGCGASMVTGPKQAEAISAWNTRHSPDAGKMGEDSARLDWFSGGIDRFLSQCPTGEWCAQDDTVGAWYGDTPRAAIDAAMQQGDGATGKT
jgi:Lar family restriction alleviation protein